MTHLNFSARARGLTALLASVLVMVGAAGCYNPKIGPRFKCNAVYEATAGQCPETFHCEDDGFCHSGQPRDGGVDLGVEKPASHDGPVEVPPSDVMPEAPAADGPTPACYAPVAGCSADPTKMCDPVCQSGCMGCHVKCSANTAGTLTCNAVPQNTRTRALLEPCDITSGGTTAQTDNCGPGLVCLMDGCGTRCYQFCNGDNDCTNAPCSLNAGGGVKVCDVPSSTCDPSKGGNVDGCGTAMDSIACYLSPTVKDRTFCDCPVLGGPPNTACSGSRDCFPGLVCANQQCRQACDLSRGSADCLMGTCTSVNLSAKWGFCN